jgi:hypothetical protein
MINFESKIFFALIFPVAFLSGTVSAQLLTVDNVLITAAPATQITVLGDVQNNANAAIDNNGIIDLTGNWTNNSGNNIFGTSTGTVTLNGSNQNIGGSSSTTFNNLTLSGSGIKTLLNNNTVGGSSGTPSGVLSVGNIVLDLNSQMLSVFNTQPAAVTFGTGYILSEDADNSSKVKWSIGSTPGVHTIPFGNTGGVQVPFSFNLTSGDAGDVTVSTYATAPDNTPYPLTPVLVTNVLNPSGGNNSASTVDRFWQIDPSGTPLAALTFTYSASENAANGNINMRSQRWNSGNTSWDAPLPVQINPTSQSVLVSNVIFFGPWAVAMESSPLPVELLSFSAVMNEKNEVELHWVTESEINNDYFTVERSLDAEHFENVLTVDGAGNTTTPHEYSTLDRTPLKGISYYRLKQTDFDGTQTFSQTVSVNNFAGEGSEVVIYPNPATEFIVISVRQSDKNAGSILFRVCDISGRTVFVKPLSQLSSSGENTFVLERNKMNVTPGTYLFRFILNNEMIHQGKLMIQ